MKYSVGNSIHFVRRNFEEILAVAIFLAIFISQSCQVFFRYVLQSPLTWTEELSRLLFIWLSFIGAVIVTKHKGHLSVDLLVSKIPEKFRKIIDAVMQSITIVFLISITVVGISFTLMAKRVTTPALEVSVGFIYAPVPFFAILTLLRMAGQIISKIKENRSAKQGSSAETRIEGV